MRFHIVSDLHIDAEHNAWTPPHVDADVVVCAGDTMSPATLALPWMRENFPHQEIVYVMGNHDFYSHWDRKRPDAGTKTTWEYQHAEAPRLAERLRIHLLNCSEAVLGDVRFVGGTLWTDFSCRGYLMHGDAVRAAARQMNDYRYIKTGAGRSRDRLTTRHTLDAHRRTVRFLERALCKPFDGKTVIVTHHAPAPNSLLKWNPEMPRVYGDLDWCYASEALGHLFTGEGLPDSFAPASLWVHGHIHANRDYQIADTRVISNARGRPLYPTPRSPRENPHFIEDLVIELEPVPKPTLGM
jgi:Calcineurin-like phosphoesterase superfamily domain